MKNYKGLLLAVLAVILIAGGYSLWQVGQIDSGEPDPTEQMTENPQAIGENVSFTVTEGEIKKWVLTAKEAIYDKTASSADLKDISGVFYNAKEEPVVEFTAPTGHYTNQHNAVTLTGGVVAKTVAKKGETQTKDASQSEIRAPKMTWSSRSKKVLAEGGVVVDYGNMGKSTADRARFTLDFSSLTLEGNVRSEIIY